METENISVSKRMISYFLCVIGVIILIVGAKLGGAVGGAIGGVIFVLMAHGASKINPNLSEDWKKISPNIKNGWVLVLLTAAIGVGMVIYALYK